MALHRTTFRPSLAVAALAGVTALSAAARDARADEVSPDGKGIVGGALLGAEVVTMGESIFGVHAPWAFGVGALVGAAGGGAAGFAVEKGSTDGRVPTYMLAGGLALVIPALVLTLNATRYMPDENATEDKAPVGPAAEPGAPGGTIIGAPPVGAPSDAPPAPPPPASPPPAPPPQALLDLHRGDFRFGVPAPDVLPVYSAAERRALAIRTAETELRLPILHVVF